jgi:hypothetical protein
MEAVEKQGWRTRWGLDERLALWMLLCVCGFAWVSLVQCGRAHPFQDRAGGYTQFLYLVCLALFLYPLGPLHVLRAVSIDGARAVGMNLLGYALPFFIGLQFFYLQNIDAINYSLNYRDFARMGPAGILVFSIGGLLLLGLLGMHLRWAKQAGMLPAYLAAIIASVLLLPLVTLLLRDTHYLHIHHWFVGAYFLPYCRFANPVSRTAQAICAGVAVEGVAEWSMAPIWERL